ncbi:MAG: hypothetical protein ONB48_18405 [candidate division KSB1 bacterium]|nr:hypothetical protein [candidate division KSB1 bacterium]MDZ7275867.1 hypothetical protein [candidate division KSB1 bacterium]MDZ7287617.1 hypothetical protein [candidate division KSB1 bacterium]MDZ7309447.1 hypothetical protein [candidate division KSB1 bacterium]MDZ7350595.1 hypothetical protein [candidate division KSB1 bacterium]
MIMRKRLPPDVIFVTAGIATALSYGMLGGEIMPAALHLPEARVPWFLALVGAQFVLLLTAFGALRRHAGDGALSRKFKWLIMGFAVVFRLCLLPQTPWLSNDIYRYVWDGRLVTHGLNPYSLPPAAPELAGLRDAAVYGRMSHTGVNTVYPPLLQYLFAAGVALAEALDFNPVLSLKAILLLFDLVLIGMLLHMLPNFGPAAGMVLLYAWHPLPVIEIAGSGHSDVVGVLCLVMAMHASRQNHHARAGLFLALAFLVKFLALLLLPFWLMMAWRSAGRRAAVRCFTAFAATILLGYAPVAGAGSQLLAGLLVYSAKWRFNDSFFAMLFNAVHALLPDRLVVLLMVPPDWEVTPTVLQTRRIDLALHLAKAGVTVLFLLISMRVGRHFWQTPAVGMTAHLPQLSLAILASLLLLSPTLQPWYLLWLLPLLCLSHEVRKAGSPPIWQPALIPALAGKPALGGLWLLTATVFLSYWILHDYLVSGLWREAAWWKWLEFGPPYGLLFWGIVAQRRMPSLQRQKMKMPPAEAGGI